jgi:regulatory protein YycH of two-component signal transduction system YycFG
MEGNGMRSGREERIMSLLLFLMVIMMWMLTIMTWWWWWWWEKQSKRKKEERKKEEKKENIAEHDRYLEPTHHWNDELASAREEKAGIAVTKGEAERSVRKARERIANRLSSCR